MATTASALKEDRVVFTTGSRNYSVRDVIDAAHFRGEVDQPWAELQARIAAEKRADDSDAELDDDAVEEAAVAFRYDYDLITAEETERWLEQRALSLAEFSEYFARSYWAKVFGEPLSSAPISFEQAASDLRELLVIELTLTGELDRMATRLAWRVAARAAAENQPTPIPNNAEPMRDEMHALEAAYSARCATLLTPEEAAREIGALRLPLTRFEIELIEFDSQDAANEAFLCVRDDGMAMEDVAQEGRYPYRRAEMILEDIPEEFQQRFLSLTPDSVLDPIARDDGYQLSRLLGKTEPRIDDPDVRARIERRILERHFAELMANHIHWQIIAVEPDSE